MASLLNKAVVKRYIKDKKSDVRVSQEFMDKLEARLKSHIVHALQLGCNQKTVRDLNSSTNQ